jgi:hypothetical protein
MSTSTELRDLANRIESCCRESRSHSIAWPIVRIACDHLMAIAKIHEIPVGDPPLKSQTAS